MNKKKKSKFLSWKYYLKFMITIVILFYLLLIFIGLFLSNKIIFPVPKPTYTDNEQIIKVSLPDKTKISLQLFEVKNPKFYIIYNHGNAVDLGLVYFKLIEASKELNSTILAYDYPGYGTSEGSPSESSLFAAADATYAYLKSLNIKDSQIIIWGRSIGSGPATYLAWKYPVAGLFLESPFKSAFTVATHIPILPFDKFNNIAKIKSIDCPLLVMQGTKDHIIPCSHGKALYKLAKAPKYKLWVKNAGHNNLKDIADEKYWQTIKDFLDSI